MIRTVQWLMWSPRRFYAVTGSLVAVAVLACTVSVWGGVHRVGGEARPSSARAAPAGPVASTPRVASTDPPAPARTSAPAPAPSATSTLAGQSGAVAAALRLVPTSPTGPAFVESGDESEVVVRVPVSGGLLDVTVGHGASGWTATGYAKAG